MNATPEQKGGWFSRLFGRENRSDKLQSKQEVDKLVKDLKNLPRGLEKVTEATIAQFGVTIPLILAYEHYRDAESEKEREKNAKELAQKYNVQPKDLLKMMALENLLIEQRRGYKWNTEKLAKFVQKFDTYLQQAETEKGRPLLERERQMLSREFILSGNVETDPALEAQLDISKTSPETLAEMNRLTEARLAKEREAAAAAKESEELEVAKKAAKKEAA